MADEDPTELLDRIRTGDELAAKELADRYVQRLIDLARSRLSPKLARRVDPDDVVQSACRSFFRQAREGGFEPSDSGDLWPLLAAITANKVRLAAKRHRAAKRSIAVEQSWTRDSAFRAISPEAIADEPSPEEAAILVEETEQMMRRLSSLQRKILELRLGGFTAEEISTQIPCTERSVRRAMGRARTYLEERLLGEFSS